MMISTMLQSFMGDKVVCRTRGCCSNELKPGHMKPVFGTGSVPLETMGDRMFWYQRGSRYHLQRGRDIERAGKRRQSVSSRASAVSTTSSPNSENRHDVAEGTTAQYGRSERMLRLPELKGDDIRHPLDKQNTALLRAIPGLSFIAESVMSPAAEKVLLLENISSSILVGPDQLPSLHKLMEEAAAILGMGSDSSKSSQPVPDLYVRQHPQPNAYTLAISGRSPFVVVHTALLDLLTPEETQAVLAHELGHLKCNHGIWLTAANVLALGTVSLLPFFSGAIEEQLLRWLRAAELTCDRAALLVAQDQRVVISALMKLAGGSTSFSEELNVDAFLRQARQYDEATSGPLGWYLRNAHTRALSHPLPVLRAREIDTWAKSEEYRTILDRGRAL